jgi:hypothetical protein
VFAGGRYERVLGWRQGRFENALHLLLQKVTDLRASLRRFFEIAQPAFRGALYNFMVFLEQQSCRAYVQPATVASERLQAHTTQCRGPIVALFIQAVSVDNISFLVRIRRSSCCVNCGTINMFEFACICLAYRTRKLEARATLLQRSRRFSLTRNPRLVFTSFRIPCTRIVTLFTFRCAPFTFLCGHLCFGKRNDRSC